MPAAIVVWMIATRDRHGLLVTATRLVIYGAAVLAIEHATFAMTCSANFLCPVNDSFFSDDQVRLHFFMAGVYTVIGAAALILLARTLLRAGKRSGWFTVLAAFGIGGTIELTLATVWFDHGFPGDTSAAARLIDDFGWTLIYTYLFAWLAALVISYRPIFPPADSRT